jgi:uncharacterized membrane protein YagU involved in acid resistance
MNEHEILLYDYFHQHNYTIFSHHILVKVFIIINHFLITFVCSRKYLIIIQWFEKIRKTYILNNYLFEFRNEIFTTTIYNKYRIYLYYSDFY